MGEETKTCTTCGRRFSDEAIFCPKDGSALVAINQAKGKDAFVGREILGHIEIRSLIGAGAMGRVYRAYQKGIDRDVAVKILHKELAANPDLVARFLREAKVSSKLDHPHVVKVLLAGQLEDGTMYLVMEYLDGISLHSALLAAGGALPIGRALHIGLQICDAVGEAHSAGVVHRDVKPENVMLVKRGDDLDFAKVLDFGIARLGQKEGGSGIETQAGLVFGTARYLSPEGARGEPVQAMSDVYAIATVIYQMLAGRTPFEHESSVSLLVAQIHDPPPPLRSIPRASYVHASIERAIMRNLAKDPGQRDTDGHIFGRALLDAASDAGFIADDLLHRPTLAKGRRPQASPISLPSSEKTRDEAYGIHGLSPIGVKAIEPRPLTPGPPAVYHPSYSGRPAHEQGPHPHEPRRVAKTMDDELTPAVPGTSDTAMATPYPPAARLPTPAPVMAGLGGATVGMPMADPSGGHPIVSPPVGTPDQESILGTTATPSEDRVDNAPGVPRRNRLAALWAVLAIVAVTALGIGGYRLGYFGGKTATANKRQEVESLLTRAQTALDARRWDAPPGDNVLELTDKIIAIAPGETRTYQIRNAASDRLMREALDKKAAGDLAEALRLLRLAAKLSPPDRGLQAVTEDIEGSLAQDPKYASLVTDGGAGKFGVKLEVTGEDPKEPPHPGESIGLVAYVTGNPDKIDPNAHFIVSGPGLVKPVLVDTHVEKNVKYIANFVFPTTGTYKAHFFGRPDNFPVQDAMDVKIVARGTYIGPAPSIKPSTSSTGYWPVPSTKPTGKPSTTTTGTITLTPDPVPFPMPTAPTKPPPPPLPTLPP